MGRELVLFFVFVVIFVFSFHPRILPREGKIYVFSFHPWLFSPGRVVFLCEFVLRVFSKCFCFFSEIFQWNLFQKSFLFFHGNFSTECFPKRFFVFSWKFLIQNFLFCQWKCFKGICSPTIFHSLNLNPSGHRTEERVFSGLYTLKWRRDQNLDSHQPTF